MAADDAAKESPDPWDDIVAGLSETAGELSFNFDEPEPVPAASPDDVEAAAATEPESPAPEIVRSDATPPADAPVAEPDDALVDDWLTGLAEESAAEPGLGVRPVAADTGDEPEEPPSLAVFSPDDAGAAAASGGPSFTAFDSGPEGAFDDTAEAADSDAADDADLVDFLSTADAGPPEGDADPWDALDAASGAADDVIDAVATAAASEEDTFAAAAFGEQASESADDGAFPGVAVAAAGAVGAATAATGAPAARPAKAAPPPRPRKKSGAVGQMVGIVLGGLMAIPITLGILIWGLGKDPFKVTKMVPEQVAFLLPAKFRPGYQKPVADGGAAASGPTLDDLPTPDIATTEPDGEPAPTDVATTEPADPAGSGADMPETDLPQPDLGDVTEPAAAPDDVAVALPPVEPAAPPLPPPLDTSALDAAVAEAAGLVEALGAVDDPNDRTRKKLLVEWYKALARVGEQLVMLEKTAADSGRPLEEAPAGFVELHARIAAQPALTGELERLGRNWLSYAKRDSPGVVLPLTFESARRVGPWWVTKAALAESDSTTRPLAVISRTEPSAVAGDRLVCTGIVLDGGVVWAADCRAPAAARTDQVDPLF